MVRTETENVEGITDNGERIGDSPWFPALSPCVLSFPFAVGGFYSFRFFSVSITRSINAVGKTPPASSAARSAPSATAMS